MSVPKTSFYDEGDKLAAKDYAVYRDDELLCIGTRYECAAYLNVKPETVQYYATATYRRRLEKRKKAHKCGRIIAIALEDE